MKRYLKLLLSVTLLTTIYMNDGSYVWVDKYSDWGKWVTNRQYQLIGIEYTFSGVVHKVPFSSIKEITNE